MAWTKLLTPEWAGTSGAAGILKTTESDIKQRIAAGEFVTRQSTPNVTEIKFHKTDGTPKFIVAVPGAADPTRPGAASPEVSMTVRDVVDIYTTLRANLGLAESASKTVAQCSITPSQLVDAFNAGILDMSRSSEEADLIHRYRNELLSHFNS